MKTINRTAVNLLVAAGCISAAQVSILQLQYRFANGGTAGLNLDVENLPIQLGGWTGESTELDSALVEKIGASNTVSRLYRNEYGHIASIHLAVYSTLVPSTPHHPQECYLGAGWTLLHDDWKTENGQRCYRLSQAVRDDATALVAYWYQIGTDVASNRDEAREILWNLRRQRRAFPPTVKVLVQVPIELSEDEAAETVKDLAAPIYDWIVTNSRTD